MNSYNKTATVLVVTLVALAVSCMIQPTQAQTPGGFSSTRPGVTLFEPTLSFIRQNLRLVNSYVALFRSIFVGAYERPLITSTDAPAGAPKKPSVRVPAIDLPELPSAPKYH